MKSLGEYDESLTHFRAAAALYPRDRVVVNQLARVLFLKRDYSAAIQELNKVLAIDPEDLQAHYNLMLCYQGVGDAEKASREQALYVRFKADEASQAITGPYRQLHPDDNNERQQIHEHRNAAAAQPYPVKAVSTSRRRRPLTMKPLMFARLGAACLVVASAWLPRFVSASHRDVQKADEGCRLIRVHFTDVTAASGIRFRHNNGAFGKKYLPETLGSGVAFLDFDNDGWQDLFYVNSMNWPGHPGQASFPALYRNNHNGTFTDVTRQAGLATQMYGLGVTAADFDNDGNVDIYVTCLGPNHLFRNAGGGKFADVTARAGVGDPGFSTSAAWFDYDQDGRLDLFVANYVQWTIDTDLMCTLDGRNKSYCTPESYQGQSSTLYHNKGDGTFEDVTRKAGLWDPTSKSLGVALLDFDNDGRMISSSPTTRNPTGSTRIAVMARSPTWG